MVTGGIRRLRNDGSPASPGTSPETWEDLQRRYNGPIPLHRLAILDHGGSLALELARARANQAQARAGVLGALRTLRLTRADLAAGGYDHLSAAQRDAVLDDKQAYLRDWWRDYCKWTRYRRDVERRIRADATNGEQRADDGREACTASA
jgi:hypothetical protein